LSFRFVGLWVLSITCMVSVGDEWALVWNVVVSVLLAALSILSAVLGFFRGGFNQSTGLSASGLGFVALGCLAVFMWVHLLRVCWSVIICIGEFSLWFMVWGFISVACCVTGYLSRSLVVESMCDRTNTIQRARTCMTKSGLHICSIRAVVPYSTVPPEYRSR